MDRTVLLAMKRIYPFITGLMLLCLCLCIGQPALAQPGRAKIIQGNKMYGDEKYDEALTKYRDAQVQAPESAIVPFNIGAAEYKKNKYEEALKETEAALKSDAAGVQAKAYYNMGNALFRLGKLPESIMAYKKSLEIDPDDEDAKYNLEFVRKKIKDEAQKEQQNPQQQQQQQQDQNQENQEQQDQQQQEQEQQQQEQQQEQQQQQQQGQEREDEMSREDAARILEALNQNEKNQKDQRKVKSRGSITVVKDW